MLRAGDKIGPYVLIAKIGKGGQGTVWKVKKPSKLGTEPTFALKFCLDLSTLGGEPLPENIRQEIANWIKLTESKHQNILPIIEAEVYDDWVVIVSEYAPDGTLRDWLRKQPGGKAASWEAACELFEPILVGIGHLHAFDIIHRDIKPENIVMQGSLPRLMDFGISRPQTKDVKSSQGIGTPDYMPPEAFDGSRSKAWDVWAAAVLFQELLTGQRPFPRMGDTTSDAALMKAILNNPPVPLPSFVPEPIRKLIAQALEKDLKKRQITLPDAVVFHTHLVASRTALQSAEQTAKLKEARDGQKAAEQRAKAADERARVVEQQAREVKKQAKVSTSAEQENNRVIVIRNDVTLEKGEKAYVETAEKRNIVQFAAQHPNNKQSSRRISEALSGFLGYLGVLLLILFAGLYLDKSTESIRVLPVVTSWSWPFVSCLAFSGIQLGSTMTITRAIGRIEDDYILTGIVKAKHLPPGILVIVAGLFFFWAVVILHLMTALVQKTLTASLLRGYGALAFVTVLFSICWSSSIKYGGEQTMVFGGNILFLGFLIGRLLGDFFRSD